MQQPHAARLSHRDKLEGSKQREWKQLRQTHTDRLWKTPTHAGGFSAYMHAARVITGFTESEGVKE